MPPLSVGEVGVWVSTIYKRLLNYAKFPQLRSSMENSLMLYIATGNVQKEPEAHPPNPDESFNWQGCALLAA
jgi:hypothetical protein